MSDVPKTYVDTDNPLTRKRWAKDLFRVILPQVEYSDVVGTGPDSIIQSRTELGKGEGDKITFGIVLPLRGDAVIGRSPVEGTEEELQTRNFSITVEEMNKAVDTGGKMEQQRVPYDFLQIGKEALGKWWSSLLSDYVINMLIGNSDFKIAGEDFAQAITEPSTNHHLLMNDRSAESSIDSSDVINLSFLEGMKQRAEIPVGTPQQNDFKVRPLQIKGKNYYVVYMHNYAFDLLRRNTNVNEWGDLARNARTLQEWGAPQAEIEYQGMLIKKTERIPCMYPDSSDSTGRTGVYRCVLCGAQAGVIAWGGAGESQGTTLSFVIYNKDAKRFVNVRAGGIWGAARVQFGPSGSKVDYGSVVGSGWASPLA